jgi:hypothetical protein
VSHPIFVEGVVRSLAAIDPRFLPSLALQTLRAKIGPKVLWLYFLLLSQRLEAKGLAGMCKSNQSNEKSCTLKTWRISCAIASTDMDPIVATSEWTEEEHALLMEKGEK